jgi:structure-specific endonuclease subunit SLX1
MSRDGIWFVYCLVNENGYGPQTYIGATVNLDRRLRQHNGVIKGGAKATHRGGSSWVRACHVAGFHKEKDALQFEWAWKYHTRSLPSGPAKGLAKRFNALWNLVHSEKATTTATPFTDLCEPLVLILENPISDAGWKKKDYKETLAYFKTIYFQENQSKSAEHNGEALILPH